MVSSGVPHDLHSQYLTKGKEKAPLEINPLSQKNKLFTSASTRTELYKTNITVESPSERTSTALFVETSESKCQRFGAKCDLLHICLDLPV